MRGVTVGKINISRIVSVIHHTSCLRASLVLKNCFLLQKAQISLHPLSPPPPPPTFLADLSLSYHTTVGGEEEKGGEASNWSSFLGSAAAAAAAAAAALALWLAMVAARRKQWQNPLLHCYTVCSLSPLFLFLFSSGLMSQKRGGGGGPSFPSF